MDLRELTHWESAPAGPEESGLWVPISADSDEPALAEPALWKTYSSVAAGLGESTLPALADQKEHLSGEPASEETDLWEAPLGDPKDQLYANLLQGLQGNQL